jgi:IS30 family transposase
MHTQLSREERELIAVYYRQWKSYAEIGRLLGRSHTTIMREINRNWEDNRAKLEIKYSCFKADEEAKRRKRDTNHKRRKLTKNHRLHKLVYEKLSDETKIRSPEAISGRLKLERGISISTTTIYNYIHKNKPERGRYLRYKQLWYKPRWTKRIVRFGGCTSIHERCKSANERKRFGDYEGDSVIGSGKAVLGVLHERKSRYIKISKLRSWEAIWTTYNIVKRLMGEKVKTLTVDRGSEFAYWETIEKKLWISMYMADGYCAWQKWWVEKNNREIRVYLPKWTSFDELTNEQIKKIESYINSKPRRILWYRTSREVFHSTNLHLL